MEFSGYHGSVIFNHRYPISFTCCHVDSAAYCLSNFSSVNFFKGVKGVGSVGRSEEDVEYTLEMECTLVSVEKDVNWTKSPERSEG